MDKIMKNKHRRKKLFGVCSRLMFFALIWCQDMYFLKLPINLATCPCLVVGFSEDFQLLLANVLSRRVHAFGSHVPCS